MKSMRTKLHSYGKQYDEREQLQALNELKYYEKFGRSSESVNPRAKMLARRIIYTPIRSSVTYEERQQRLINAIMRDIKAKGKKSEA